MSKNLPDRIGGASVVLLLAFSVVSSALGADGPSAILKAYPRDRYEGLLAKSPFAVATAAPEPEVKTENFATNWIMTGLSKSRGKDGTSSYTAFVRSRDLSTRLVLTMGDKPNADGVSLVSVDEAAVAAKSVVVLKKGEETGKVGFDQAAVASAPPPAPGAPAGATPGAAGKPTISGVRPAPSRAPIPRPGMSAQPRAATPTTAPTPQPARGRVRPVEEAPAPAQ